MRNQIVLERRRRGANFKGSSLLCCFVVIATAWPRHSALADDEALTKRVTALEAEIKEMRATNLAQARELNRRITRTHAAIKARSVSEPAPGEKPVFIPKDALPSFVTARKGLQFGSITITPGGFLAAEGIYRSRNVTADVATPFFAIPTLNSPYAYTHETRGSARQSRATLLVEGIISPNLIASAYGELDFLGAAPTANQVEANSYNPRLRNLYAGLDMLSSGWHLLVGQNWTLATLNSKGITPRNEVAPPTIDAYLVPGFVWVRQPQIRITKDFDKKLWASVSIEQPQTTFAGTGCTTGAAATGIGAAGVSGITCSQVGSTFFNSTTAYSLNDIPDVIAKVAYEARVAGHNVHLEGFGMYRDFYDRVAYTDHTNASQHTPGYGLGLGLIAQVIPQRLEFQASGLWGRGIGRYGTSQLPDATFSADGAIKPISETMLLTGLTLHATPSLDVYAFAGIEKEQRSYFQNGPIVSAGTTASGYYGLGVPNADNSGCYVEGSAACSTATNSVAQATIGLWDKIYKGPYGEVRTGIQYSHTKRVLFSSVFDGTYYSPKTDENTVMTSLRYYPFQ